MSDSSSSIMVYTCSKSHFISRQQSLSRLMAETLLIAYRICIYESNGENEWLLLCRKNARLLIINRGILHCYDVIYFHPPLTGVQCRCNIAHAHCHLCIKISVHRCMQNGYVVPTRTESYVGRHLHDNKKAPRAKGTRPLHTVTTMAQCTLGIHSATPSLRPDI